MNEIANQELNQDQVGFFEESTQESSSVRLMGFLALIGAIIFGLLTVLHAGNHGSEGDASNGIYITFGFLISAFAPKTVQKFAENKIDK